MSGLPGTGDGKVVGSGLADDGIDRHMSGRNGCAAIGMRPRGVGDGSRDIGGNSRPSRECFASIAVRPYITLPATTGGVSVWQSDIFP